MTSKEPFVIKYSMLRELFKDTRLVDENNNFIQRFKVYDAMKKAEQVGLDLVCFNMPEGTNLAFCKIINFGKWKYNQDKATKQQEKVSKKEIKEMKFSPHISEHDLSYKTKQIHEFLKEGADVVLSMKVTGRDKSHMNIAEQKMNSIVTSCLSGGFGKEVARKRNEYNFMIRLAPNTKGENNGMGTGIQQ